MIVSAGLRVKWVPSGHVIKTEDSGRRSAISTAPGAGIRFHMAVMHMEMIVVPRCRSESLDACLDRHGRRRLPEGIINDLAHRLETTPAARPAPEAAIDRARRPGTFLAVDGRPDTRVGNRVAGTDDHFFRNSSPDGRWPPSVISNQSNGDEYAAAQE